MTCWYQSATSWYFVWWLLIRCWDLSPHLLVTGNIGKNRSSPPINFSSVNRSIWFEIVPRFFPNILRFIKLYSASIKCSYELMHFHIIRTVEAENSRKGKMFKKTQFWRPDLFYHRTSIFSYSVLSAFSFHYISASKDNQGSIQTGKLPTYNIFRYFFVSTRLSPKVKYKF